MKRAGAEPGNLAAGGGNPGIWVSAAAVAGVCGAQGAGLWRALWSEAAAAERMLSAWGGADPRGTLRPWGKRVRWHGLPVLLTAPV